MTVSKVLERLLAFAPPLIAASVRVPARCVFATAVGIDVLRRFGIDAHPQAVILRIASARYVAAVQRGATPVVAVARGGHLMEIAPSDRVREGHWGGHLVIALPHALLDLDHQQFSRPTVGLQLPPATLIPWPPDARAQVFQYNGHALRIALTEDETFRQAPDWIRVAARQPVVDRVVHAVRRGALGRHADQR